MCLAIPGRVVAVEVGPSGERTAIVAYPAEHRRASLLFLPDAGVGDHVLVQAGFAIRRLTPEQAAETAASLARAEELVRTGASAGGAPRARTVSGEVT